MINAVSQQVYSRIDNDMYQYDGDQWWKGNNVYHLLKGSVNPCRFPFFVKSYTKTLGRRPEAKLALEVGCGGGILAEEIASAGFKLIGIDPAERSLQTAREHAKIYGLDIEYMKGTGENIPFPDHHFDVLFCCDVLEHVRDLPKCISEFSRVLKPGGVFFFDTFNRNPMSKLFVIKLWQDWKATAMMPSRLHVYEMFIKPNELRELMLAKGFGDITFRGMSPNINPFKMISLLRQRAKGKITYEELSNTLKLKESSDTIVGYMGFGIKK